MLEKILNDIEYKDVDQKSLRSEVERLIKKYRTLNDHNLEFVVRARLRSIFGKRGAPFEPQPLNIQKKLSEYGL